MPVAKRGFLFRYFDKIICGIVAVGLLLAIAYAVQRRASATGQVDVAEIHRDAEIIKNTLAREAVEVPVPDYMPQIRKWFVARTPPGTVRPNLIWPELPQQYPPYRVGPDKEFALKFMEPLAKDSIEVDDEGLVTLSEHPVDNDYRRAKFRSGSSEGTAKVTGSGAGVPHIYPVVVDASVGKTAYPPIELAVADDMAAVLLEFQPDPNIRKDEVQVLRYEVERRDWSDPLGEYHGVGGLDMSSGRPVSFGGVVERRVVATTRTGPRPAVGPAPGMMDDPMAGTRDPMMMFDPMTTGGMRPGARRVRPISGADRRQPGVEAAEETFQWQDNGVLPAERYSYRVRMVGANTFPAEGEFTEPVMAKVQPSVDFRFTGVSFDKVRFEVAQSTLMGIVPQPFNVMIGGEIGGIAEGTVTEESFLTGLVLVDYHRSVRRPGTTSVSSRVIYADAEGNLHVRWQNEAAAESGIFDLISGTGVGMPGRPGRTTPPRRLR